MTQAAAEPAARRFARRVEAVFGLPFDVCGIAEAVERLRAAAFSNTRCFVSTPNVNFAVAARSDPAFLDSILRSDLCLPDGMPIVWAARCLKAPIRERVAGATVFEALAAAPGPPLDVFFFGGPPGAAAAACERLNAGGGGLRCVGFDSGGYGSVDELSGKPTIQRINASGAHFVVAALGARKGQAWLARNADALDAPLLCHLGAVVNFAAGTKARAPVPWQRAGLEWLWRIKEEPMLWRRYAADGFELVRLLASGVGPAAVFDRLQAPSRRPPASLTVDASNLADVEVRLHGDWTRDALEPLRQAFVALAEQTPRPRRIRLDASDVGRIDNAFVGLVLLALGTFGHDAVRITSAAPRTRRLLRYNFAEPMLDVVTTSATN